MCFSDDLACGYESHGIECFSLHFMPNASITCHGQSAMSLINVETPAKSMNFDSPSW
jgi:hypothetical protein